MRHNIDHIALRITIFLILFFAISFFARSIWQAVLFSFLGTIALSVILHIIAKHHERDNMSFSSFLQTCIIRGNSYVFDIVTRALNIENATTCDNTLTYHPLVTPDNKATANVPVDSSNANINNLSDPSVLTDSSSPHENITNGDNIMIVNALRFGNVSADEIIKYHNIALSKNIKELYIIARILDRRSMSIASSFVDVKYIVIGARKLYRIARSHSLTQRTSTTRPPKTNTFKQILQIALSRNLAPRYLLTAVILGVMSVFTPLRIYYIVIASVTLLLALLCLSGISSAIAPTKLGIFGSNSHVKPKQNKRND